MDNIHKLETEPVGRLLLQYALPAVITQVVASVYNIVDRVFLGQYVGALAIAGLPSTKTWASKECSTMQFTVRSATPKSACFTLPSNSD